MSRKALLLSFLLVGALHSEEEVRSRCDQFNIGVGVFNIVRHHRPWQYQVEYRWDVKYHLRPLVSLMATDKGSLYFCAGLGYDIFMGKYLVLTPSFAPGLYVRGSGKSLHFPLEFRSSMDLAYILPNKGRLGAQFYHISNASLGHKNPGAESLIFYYAVPIPRK
ncbi:MAG: acyloxyacyl hydrolase [Chlamydiales bacterium]|nr:acyloxyacyl hydrolase [Chlamydiales bacterium]